MTIKEMLGQGLSHMWEWEPVSPRKTVIQFWPRNPRLESYGRARVRDKGNISSCHGNCPHLLLKEEVLELYITWC